MVRNVLLEMDLGEVANRYLAFAAQLPTSAAAFNH